ncbi:MAG: hypothetical protein CMJ13_05670 [Pelagibacterales bacterium]|nr:hypothetical protein [Pelagibacterales bacterium]|tara:strand:+ start:152 stop:703 length:552 start_codon:yes stop_codon:yes gene_type:complete
MYKIKNINLTLDNEYEEFENLQLTKYCEWPNCEKKGEYKAPTSREKLRVFKFFCLKHIKEYNKSWDYFKGRTTDEIYNEVSNDAYWHRKTSKKVNNFKIEDKLNLFERYNQKPKASFDKSIDNKIQASLNTLEIKNFCTISQLKRQYKIMVKKYHPDLNKSGSNEKIIKLNEAYSSLINFIKK